MQIEKLSWTNTGGWTFEHNARPADLVLYFGSRELLNEKSSAALKAAFPVAQVVGCSSASQIAGADIVEDGLAGVALKFHNARIRAEAVDIASGTDSDQSTTSSVPPGSRGNATARANG